MKIDWILRLPLALLCFGSGVFAVEDGGAAANCETGDMTNSRVHQPDLIGKWKQIGIEEDGKISKIKIDLTHEFTSDCKLLATMGGETSTYSYTIDGGVLVLKSALTDSTHRKEFSKVSKDTITHGGDVFNRIE